MSVPYVLGLIATRSFDKPVEGIKPLVRHNEERIRKGLPAYKWLTEQGGRPNARRAGGTRRVHARSQAMRCC